MIYLWFCTNCISSGFGYKWLLAHTIFDRYVKIGWLFAISSWYTPSSDNFVSSNYFVFCQLINCHTWTCYLFFLVNIVVLANFSQVKPPFLCLIFTNTFWYPIVIRLLLFTNIYFFKYTFESYQIHVFASAVPLIHDGQISNDKSRSFFAIFKSSSQLQKMNFWDAIITESRQTLEFHSPR